MRTYVFADCETTGVTPSDKMVEIAYAVYNTNMDLIHKDESLIDPEMPIPSGASAVHHITNQRVADEPTIEQFMKLKANPLQTEAAPIFVAHNASFDWRYFKPWMHPEADVLCTLRLAKKLCPGLDSYKLQALRYSLDLPDVEGDAHRAGADVEMLVNLTQYLMIKAETDMEGLLALAKAPLDIKTMPFGKHKGKVLKDVPEDYFSWLLKQDNVDPDLAASIRKIHTHL